MIREILLSLAAGRDPGSVVLDEHAGPRLVVAAVGHGLLGLLDSAVQARQLELSREAHRLLAAEALHAEAHRRRLLDGVDHVLAAAAAAGIEVAFFKGLPAETRWYRHELERPCTDLDVFVPPHAVDALDDLVHRLDPRHPMVGRVVELVDRHGIQSIEVIDDARVAVDIHVDPFKIDIPFGDLDGVWTRTALVPAGGRQVRALGGADSLVQFLLHLNRDGFSHLRGFADVARLITADGGAIAAAVPIVETAGVGVPVWSSLRHVVDLLDLDTPTPATGGPRSWLWRRCWGAGRAPRSHHVATVALPLTTRPVTRAIGALIRRRVVVDRDLRAYYRAGSTGAAWWRTGDATSRSPAPAATDTLPTPGRPPAGTAGDESRLLVPGSTDR